MDIYEDDVVYEFTASDGVVIKLRRMSDRQRSRVLNFTVAEIQKAFTDFLQMLVGPDGTLIGTSEEEIQPYYDRFLHGAVKMCKDILVNPDDAHIIESWNHPGDYPDINNLLNGIIAHEQPQSDVIPKPDKVDEMSDEEVKRLGESSARKSRRGNISQSLPAEATSSSGAGNTQDEKPVISEMSPTQS